MVNHNNIFKKIGYILNELQDQYQFLSENPEQLSELELELFLANANFLTDHIQIVKKLTINQPVKELPAATPEEEEVVVPFSFKEQVTPPPAPKQEFFDEPIQNEVITDEPIKYEPVRDEPMKAENMPTFEFILNDRSPAETIDLEEVVADNHHEEQVDYDEELAKSQQEAEDIEEYDNEVTYLEPSIDEVGLEPFLVYNDVEHKPVNEAPRAEEVVPEPVAPVSEPVAPIVTASPSTPPPAPVFQQRAPEPVPAFKEDDLKAQEIPKATTTFVQDRVEEKIVQPAANAPRPTLNDLLASQKSNSFNQENTTPIVTDLKKAVNLNEKLLYIKDLFNGYNLAYSEAIDIINKLPDLKSADSFLQNNYAIKNNWQTKQATVDKFYGLLKQRFPED